MGLDRPEGLAWVRRELEPYDWSPTNRSTVDGYPASFLRIGTAARFQGARYRVRPDSHAERAALGPELEKALLRGV